MIRGKETGAPPRVPLAIVVLAVAIVGTWRSVLTVQNAGDPVYYLPTQAVAAVLVAAAISVLAAIALVILGRPAVALPALLAAAVITFSFLVFPTLSFLFFVLMVVIIAVWSRRSMRWRTAVPSMAAAGLLAIALTALFVAGIQRPIVQCLPGGAAINGPGPWSGENSGSVGSSSTRDGRTHGTVSFGARTYSFVCNGTRLVSFRKG
jgi:hypothetical protein